MDGAGNRPRGQGRRVHRAAPDAPGRRGEASGSRLPVHLLLTAAGATAALASGVRRGAPGGSSYASLKGYDSVDSTETATVARSYVASQQPLLTSLRALLTATASRPASFGCLGLHEWAMVHRLSEEQTRHADWPLRLGASGTDAVVESHRIVCSHFDAFRFFTPDAQPLNQLQPGRDDRAAFEQPGCLHAGMDLYKHAFRLTPMVCSDLVADCFELARDIRVLDMRAAPYDLTDLGFEPVRIQTPEGKQEYAAAQRGFAERGAPLRARLIEECDRLLAVALTAAG